MVGVPMYLTVDQARVLLLGSAGGSGASEGGLAWCAGCRENLARHDEAWQRRATPR